MVSDSNQVVSSVMSRNWGLPEYNLVERPVTKKQWAVSMLNN